MCDATEVHHSCFFAHPTKKQGISLAFLKIFGEPD
jgi:hypothetical protein